MQTDQNAPLHAPRGAAALRPEKPAGEARFADGEELDAVEVLNALSPLATAAIACAKFRAQKGRGNTGGALTGKGREPILIASGKQRGTQKRKERGGAAQKVKKCGTCRSLAVFEKKSEKDNKKPPRKKKKKLEAP